MVTTIKGANIFLENLPPPVCLPVYQELVNWNVISEENQ